MTTGKKASGGPAKAGPLPADSTLAKSAKLIATANRRRAALGLPPISAGFHYAKAVRFIQADHSIDLTEIAGCIGHTEPGLQKLLAGAIPKHITGELLWGLCVDLYGQEKAKELFCDSAQVTGGRVKKLKPRSHSLK